MTQSRSLLRLPRDGRDHSVNVKGVIKMSQQKHGTTTEHEKSGQQQKDQGKSQQKNENTSPMDRGKSGQHDQGKHGSSDKAGESGHRS